MKRSQDCEGCGGGGGGGGNVDQVGTMERKLPADWPAGVRHCSSVKLYAIVYKGVQSCAMHKLTCAIVV